jgi:hypothetical protein
MQNNTVTVKNSLARNLHRLRTAILFISRIMSGLAEDRSLTLSGAVSSAYVDTLAQYHSAVLRGTCNAGFLLLPTRQAFLASIGETGTARAQLLCNAGLQSNLQDDCGFGNMK